MDVQAALQKAFCFFTSNLASILFDVVVYSKMSRIMAEKNCNGKGDQT